MDPEAESAAADPRDPGTGSARSNPNNSFPFTLDAHKELFLRIPLIKFSDQEKTESLSSSQQMRKVPLSTFEVKGYNQEGLWQDFDSVKPGTLRGSLKNCSPECPFIPSRTVPL